MPIFGMNLAVAAIARMVFLGEGVQATKIAGVHLAAGTIFLLRG